MRKTIIIACYDEIVKTIIKKCVLEINSTAFFIECKYEKDVFKAMSNNENFVVFFDKYFLGYSIENTLLRMERLKKNGLICFCECDKCSVYFGLRIKEHKADCFISEIEKNDHLKVELNKVLNGLRTFPEEVFMAVEDGTARRERKYFTEPTRQEMRVAMFLGQGLSEKEIAYELRIKPQAVYIHVGRVRRKVGYKNAIDFAILYRRNLFLGGDD